MVLVTTLESLLDLALARPSVSNRASRRLSEFIVRLAQLFRNEGVHFASFQTKLVAAPESKHFIQSVT